MTDDQSSVGRLTHELGLMARAYRIALSPMSETLGLLPGAIAVMIVLRSSQPCRQVDLAAELLITPSGLSRHISELVDAGYVGRRTDDNDRRASLIEITPKGHALLDKASDIQTRTMASALADWSDDEVAAAVTVITKLRSALHSQAQKPTAPQESEPRNA